MALFSEPGFIVDANMGKTARWLRLMGYDARFFNDGEDRLLISIALREGRIVLTRDTSIANHRPARSGQLKVITFTSDSAREQLRRLFLELNIQPDYKPFSVCIECNQPLAELDVQAARNRVPPYVAKTQKLFRECPCCRRVYWRGTHWEEMSRRLKQWLNKR